MSLHQAAITGGLLDARRQVRRSTLRATRYLRSVARGITTDCSFDPGFDDPVALAELRGAVQGRVRGCLAALHAAVKRRQLA